MSCSINIIFYILGAALAVFVYDYIMSNCNRVPAFLPKMTPSKIKAFAISYWVALAGLGLAIVYEIPIYYRYELGLFIKTLYDMHIALTIAVAIVALSVFAFAYFLSNPLRIPCFLQQINISLVQKTLLTFYAMTAVIRISDLFPFPGGVVLNGRPCFLGGWMIGLCIVLPAWIVAVFRFAIQQNESLTEGLCVVWLPAVLSWFIPFKSFFGWALLPISIHAIRALLFPCTGFGLIISIVPAAALACLRGPRRWIVSVLWCVLSWTITIGFSLRLVPLTWPYDKFLLPTEYSTNLLAQRANETESLSTLQTVIKAANSVEYPEGRSRILLSCVETAIELEQKQLAFNALITAIRATENIEDTDDQSRCLLACIEAVRNSIEDPEDQSKLLVSCIETAIKLEIEQLVNDLLKSAIQIAERIGDSKDLSRALIACAEGTTKLKRMSDADARLKTVIQAAHRIRNDSYRSDVLSKCRDSAEKLGFNPKYFGL